ncbi:Vacuolar protein sorting/targeting protein 10, partial [Smittium culicis]
MNFCSYALYFFYLFLLPIYVIPDSNKIKVSKTEFDSTFSQVFIFKGSSHIVAIDPSKNLAYSSTNEGVDWKPIDSIPKGSAHYLFDHPFDTNTLFILSDSTTHFITKDAGKTWASFKVPHKPFLKSQSVLSFNAARVGYIIYM